MKLFYIGLLGGLGCVLRYLLTLWTQQLAGRNFPYGTLLVNVSGSFLLGLLLTVGQHQSPPTPDVRLGWFFFFFFFFFFFSTFSYQTLLLLEEGDYWTAGVNVLCNVVLCLTGVFAGMLVARQLA